MTRKCPECGSSSSVVQTRETELTVWRRRECIRCKVRWSTWEATTNPERMVEAMREAMTKIKTAAKLGEAAIEQAQRLVTEKGRL